jgi:hypothetical protein
MSTENMETSNIRDTARISVSKDKALGVWCCTLEGIEGSTKEGQMVSTHAVDAKVALLTALAKWDPQVFG